MQIEKFWGKIPICSSAVENDRLPTTLSLKSKHATLEHSFKVHFGQLAFSLFQKKVIIIIIIIIIIITSETGNNNI